MSKLFIASLLAFLIGMACPVNRIDLPGQPQDFSILFTFGRHGRGNGQFNYPTGVAISPSGDIVVADTGNNRIQVFDSTGKFLRKFGDEGSEDGQFGEDIINPNSTSEVDKIIQGL